MNDRAQFLAERKLGIGGSDCAAILGASKWKTALDVWMEKTGQTDETPDNPAMFWGRTLEPVIRNEYAARTGREVIVPELMVFHDLPFIIAHLDGLTNDGRILEVKTARTSDGWGEEGTDEIPLEYTAQVHHYMLVSGARVADVAVLIGGSDFRIYTVESDEDLQRSIIDMETDFWRRVQDMDPPAPQTAADVETLFRKDSGQTIEASDDIFLAWAELNQVRDDLADMEKRKDELSTRIKLYMGQAATLEREGRKLCTWKASKDSQRFDMDGFKEKFPSVYQQNLKTVPGSRRFLIKE